MAVMTGSAEIARFITSLCVISGLCSVAHAAAPRDAVKRMPTITHTSQFRYIDRPHEGQLKEEYLGEWKINWRSPAVPLGSGAVARFDTLYAVTLSDYRDRASLSSGDYRQDMYDFNLRLEKAEVLQASFRLKRSDRYRSDQRWDPVTAKTTNLGWRVPRFGTLSMANVVTSTHGYVDGERKLASLTDMTTYKAERRQDEGAFGQLYAATVQRTYTRNYMTGEGTNRDLTTFEGNRLLPMGSAGKLTLSYRLQNEVKSDKGISAVRSSDTAEYVLRWEGGVGDFPLGYSAEYISNSRELANEAWNTSHIRRFTLTFRPPVPEGKAALLRLIHEMTETESQDTAGSVEKQTVQWSFDPNPRTAGSVTYWLKNDTDRKLKRRTREEEKLTGKLEYRIPGSRGNLAGTYEEQVIRQPATGDRTVNRSVDLNNQLILGPGAWIRFLHGQISGDRQDPLGLPTGTDLLRSGVQYYLVGVRDLTLDATWQQYLRSEPTDRKSSWQTIQLVFNYSPMPQWQYQLELKSKDSTTRPDASPLGYRYETGDEVVVRVTYTF